MPNSSTVNLLINSGVAGIFAVFAILIFEKFIRYLEKQDTKFIEHLGKQNATFIEFLKGEREQRMQVMHDAMVALGSLKDRVELPGQKEPTKRRPKDAG